MINCVEGSCKIKKQKYTNVLKKRAQPFFPGQSAFGTWRVWMFDNWLHTVPGQSVPPIYCGICWKFK